MVQFSGQNRAEKLFVYDGDHETLMRADSDISVVFGEINKKIDLQPNEKKILAPGFFLFSEKDIEEKNLIDLKNIRF